MERKEALRKLRRRLGPQFAYEIRKDAPTADERALADERAPILAAARDAASKALEARRTELLRGDAEYQRLLAEYRATDKARTENSAIRHVHKITVGTANSMFFHVAAQGDSWEDVFAQLLKQGKALSS